MASAAGELEFLDAAARLLSPWAERALLRKIATDLLAAYLGPRSGRLAYDGQIERGDVHTIHAALWCCDLRGFTALSDRLPRPKLVAILNRWFDMIGAAIEAGGGEILKFMGDGLLAVFPLEGEGASSCDRALEAAEQAVADSHTLDELLAQRGEPPLPFGLALHVGDVEYGNIGTRHRLDFTVIGPAVNMASRLESLTKELGVAAVASADFARGTAASCRRSASIVCAASTATGRGVRAGPARAKGTSAVMKAASGWRPRWRRASSPPR